VPAGKSGSTHTRMPGGSGPDAVPAGKFAIHEADMDAFMRKYFKRTFEKGAIETMNELPLPNYEGVRLSKGRVDLDFAFPLGTDRHMYDIERDIVPVVALYCDKVCDYVAIEEPFEVIITQKDRPNPKESNHKKFMSDGIHWSVPSGMVASRAIHEEVRKAILQEGQLETLLGHIPLIEKNWEEVYDKAVYSGGWFLYGSRKPDCLPYKAVWRVLYDPQSRTLRESARLGPEFETFENVCRMRVQVPPDTQASPLTDIGAMVPDHERRGGGAADGGSGGAAGGAGRAISRGNHLLPCEEEEIFEHVANIANTDATPYDTWYKLGQTLHNISECDEFLQAWVKWSSTSSKHVPGKCEALWPKLSKRQNGQSLSIGTICHLSKESNPAKFKEIQNGCMYKLMDEASLTHAEHPIAKVIEKLFGKRFKCVSRKDGTWYEFLGHTWQLDEDGMAVRKTLSNEVCQLFRQREHYYITQRQQFNSDPEGDKYKYWDSLFNGCHKLCTKLNRSAFKDSVVREACEVFHDQNFFNTADMDKFLLGCANGVFDMRTLEFRPGQVSDNITYSTMHEYHPEKPWKSLPGAEELWGFICDIYPIPEMREYWLDIEAEGLCGESTQKMWVHEGSGANGKTLAESLMHASLGQYSVELKAQVLTQPMTASNAANPELKILRGVRRATLEEPEKGRAINTSIMKVLAGGKLSCRGMFERKLHTFEVFAKIHIQTNSAPKVDSNDGGVWRRLERFIFPTEFKYDYEFDEKNPNHRHRIHESIMKPRVVEWGPVMLALLIQRYITRRQSGMSGDLRVPECVQEYTRRYREANDSAMRFVNEMIIPAPADKTARLGKTELSTMIRDWNRDDPEQHRVSGEEVIAIINKKYGPPEHRGWKGVRGRKLDEEGASDDEAADK
jgi:phage/plasmid-associated DNA primase